MLEPTHPILSGKTAEIYFLRTKMVLEKENLNAVKGKPLAKRGRIPGITPNPRLKKVEFAR